MEDHDDALRCHRCRQARPTEELDRMIWCEECLRAERRRAAWWGRAMAFLAAVALSFWIAIHVQPSEQFLLLWALVVIVAFYLGSRLGTELVFGVVRVRNVPDARKDEASASPRAQNQRPR
jgi:hypothetical protein